MAEIDREKVIRGLEISIISDTDAGFSTIEIPVRQAENILALLKEQEAKNVIAEKRKILDDDSYDEAMYCEDTFYHCPSCNRNLSRTHMNKDIHFCSSCGQAVKWDG